MTIFEDLIPDPIPAGVKVLYGTVTGSSPLRVQVDRDPGPLPVTPTTTVACAVGDRVVMLSHVRADNPDARARAVVVVGVIGGVPPYPVHRCELSLSEGSSSAGVLQNVNMSISTQTGGFSLGTSGVLVPATGLWRAVVHAESSVRPTSSSTRHWVQVLVESVVAGRTPATMEEYVGATAEVRATAGDEFTVEWLPGATSSLTGRMTLTYIGD